MDKQFPTLLYKEYACLLLLESKLNQVSNRESGHSTHGISFIWDILILAPEW